MAWVRHSCVGAKTDLKGGRNSQWTRNTDADTDTASKTDSAITENHRTRAYHK